VNAPSDNGRRGAAQRYKMKQLVDATGLPRQAIHFYIQEGLVPAGKKTGKNMAWYSDEHLSRLLIIKKLQHERFLPLKVIKAVLDGRETSYSADQRTFLEEVRGQLGSQLAPKTGPAGVVDADAAIERLELVREDLDRAIELELISVVVAEDGRRMMDESKVWLLEHFASLRKIGFSRELGFTVDELAFYDEHMQKLVDTEVGLLYRHIRHLPPARVAELIESGLPLVHSLIARLHDTKIRELFGALI
jgi:DNA-binding transcriptional MerR regulator